MKIAPCRDRPSCTGKGRNDVLNARDLLETAHIEEVRRVEPCDLDADRAVPWSDTSRGVDGILLGAPPVEL